MILLRLLLLAAVCAGSGCLVVGANSETAGDDPDRGGQPEPDDGLGAGCAIAADCVLAASSCCDCPSFAVSAEDGYGLECEDVDCGPTGVCPAVEAICDLGQCVAVCAPIATEKLCPEGFARDAIGCLLDTCAAPSPESGASACSQDSDCQQIPADCCGCARGGQDQAVLGSQAEQEVEALNCPDEPTCPEVDSCREGDVPRCIAASCVLAAADGLGDSEVLCGTPDLPACPTGSSCYLNALSAKDASYLGVGVCVPE